MSRVRADQYTNNAGTGSPLFTHGVRVTGVATATSFDGDLTGDVTGNADTATYAPTAGIATNAQGLTGTPNLNVGVITATEFSGDGSNLDNIKSGITTFIASGTISNGNTIVINTDGTVSAVSGSGSINPSVGISSVFEEASSTLHIGSTYDSTNNKVIVAYQDGGNSNYGTAVVGTVVGTGITFGTPVQFVGSNSSRFKPVYDSVNDRVVIVYRDDGNSSQGYAIVGVVSGDSISFPGAATMFESGITNYISATYDSLNGLIVIAYSDVSNNSYGKAIVGEVNTTTNTIAITQGSEATFHTVATSWISAVYDSNQNKVAIFYNDGTSNDGTAIIGTVNESANTINFSNSTPTVYETNTTNHISAVYDPTNKKILIAYEDTNQVNGKAIVATVNGNAVYFGNPVIFESAHTDYISTTYDSNYQRIVIAYEDQVNSIGKAVTGTIRGTSIDFGNSTTYNSAQTSNVSIVYDSTNKKSVISYTDSGNSAYGTSKVFSSVSLTTNLTSENYIGIAEEAIADGATGKVNVVGGVNTSQTGLTTAQKYYVNPLGGLSVDPIVAAGGNTAGIPIIIAGTSISDTSIIVNGEDDSSTSSGSGSGTGGLYGDNDVDAHLNRDGTVGVSSVLGWNGNDYNWQPPGGAWQLISTITASSASTVDFTSGIDSTYRQYVILGSEITGTNYHLYMQFYVNGSIFQSGNYRYSHGYFYDYSVGHPVDTMWVETGSATYLQLTGNSSDKITNPTIVKITIDNPSVSKLHYTVDWDLTGGDASDASATNYKLFGSGSLERNTAFTNVNGVRFYPSSGTISGTFKLYGIK
tara:strand:+ start:786 stop:3224 length:2439 start_codon:yes stop_codon:yes gene_type:complete